MARKTKHSNLGPRILKQYWELGEKASKADKDRVFNRIIDRISAEKNEPPMRVLQSLQKENKLRALLPPFIKYAAVFVLLSLSSLLFFDRISIDYPKAFIGGGNVWIRKANPKGQKSTIRLSDGTEIRLNAESVLFYPENFEKNCREIQLIGEAWFEVAHEKSRPFIVSTGNIKTTVLGTQFNIRAFPDDEFIEVALKSGKVQIELDDSHKSRQMVLMPDEMAVYNRYDQAVHRQAFNTDEILGWKDGVIVFRDAGFEEIRNTLERWYNVNIEVVENRQIQTKFTGSFKNETLEQVLEGIGFSCNFKFKITDKKVTINTDV